MESLVRDLDSTLSTFTESTDFMFQGREIRAHIVNEMLWMASFRLNAAMRTRKSANFRKAKRVAWNEYLIVAVPSDLPNEGSRAAFAVFQISLWSKENPISAWLKSLECFRKFSSNADEECLYAGSCEQMFQSAVIHAEKHGWDIDVIKMMTLCERVTAQYCAARADEAE